MPGFLLHVGAQVRCAHTIPAVIPPMQPRVMVMGQAVTLLSTVITVAGCPFQIPVGLSTKPQPCVTVKWSMPAARVRVMGLPVAVVPALGPGPAVCLSPDQVPNGPPLVGFVQTRVFAI